MGQLSLTVEGLLLALPFASRCNCSVEIRPDGVASCYQTYGSPSWPRAGHPCGTPGAVTSWFCLLPGAQKLLSAELHRIGREPSILYGDTRCRYQLVPSKPKLLPRLRRNELTSLAVFAEQSLEESHGTVTKWFDSVPYTRPSHAGDRRTDARTEQPL